DLRHPLLFFGCQHGTAAYEAEVIALDKAQLVGIQLEAPAPRMGIGDALGQFSVENNPHLMLREPRRVIAGDRLERVIGIARSEVEEHPAYPIEQTAATLYRFDRVGKAGPRGGIGDYVDFGDLLLHAPIESLRKMFGANTIERRHAERRDPVFKKRIFAHAAVWRLR